MAIYSDMNHIPESGFPVLSDVSDRICLNTLYWNPLKPAGFWIDVVGANRLLGALTIGGALTGVTSLTISGALTGVTSLTMSGALSGVTTIGASGTVTLSSATAPLTLSGADAVLSMTGANAVLSMTGANAVLSMTGANASIGTNLSRVGRGYFKNLEITNPPTVSGEPVALIADLVRYQPLDADLTALAGLDATAGLLKQTGAGAFTKITDSSANWDTAYGWGDHAGLYSLLDHSIAEHTFDADVDLGANHGLTIGQELFIKNEAAGITFANSEGETLASILPDIAETLVIGGTSYGAALFFGNLTNTQTFTFPDLSGTIVTTAGAGADVNLGAYNITAANLAISNWNTAYGWGDHALAGYLTAETDPNAWLKTGDQTGLSGTKTGTYNIVTTGTGEFGAKLGIGLTPWAFLDVKNPGGTGGVPTFRVTNWRDEDIFQVFDRGRIVINSYSTGGYALAINSYGGFSALYTDQDIRVGYVTSTVATGTKPYACTSTTLNTNLNADLLDGSHASAFQAAGTYVTSVTGTAPVVSSGGTTPAISMAAATSSVNGYLTSANWTTFNSKADYSFGANNFTGTGDFTTTGTGNFGKTKVTDVNDNYVETLGTSGMVYIKTAAGQKLNIPAVNLDVDIGEGFIQQGVVYTIDGSAVSSGFDPSYYLIFDMYLNERNADPSVNENYFAQRLAVNPASRISTTNTKTNTYIGNEILFGSALSLFSTQSVSKVGIRITNAADTWFGAGTLSRTGFILAGTWDTALKISSGKLIHDAGTFDFDNDNLLTTGNITGAIIKATTNYQSSDGSDGFTGTGAYTNFTIKNGLIVAAS